MNNKKTIGILLFVFLIGCSHSKDMRKKGVVSLNINSETPNKVYNHEPKKYGLFIGINKFRKEISELKYPASDAKKLADILKDPEYGNFDDVVLLNKDELTTRENILIALDVFKRMITNKNDIAVLFVSSHGNLAYDSDGNLNQYILTSDTTDNISASAINMREIKYYFDNIISIG